MGTPYSSSSQPYSRVSPYLVQRLLVYTGLLFSPKRITITPAPIVGLEDS